MHIRLVLFYIYMHPHTLHTYIYVCDWLARMYCRAMQLWTLIEKLFSPSFIHFASFCYACACACAASVEVGFAANADYRLQDNHTSSGLISATLSFRCTCHPSWNRNCVCAQPAGAEAACCGKFALYMWSSWVKTCSHTHTDSVPSFALCTRCLMNSRSQFSSYFWLTLDLKGARTPTFARISKCVCVCIINVRDFQRALLYPLASLYLCLYNVCCVCVCALS